MGDLPVKETIPRQGTLSRGLAIMDTLLSAMQPMSLIEIAESVGLEQSTTLRLLRSLEENRQLIRLGDGKKYCCSPHALRPLSLLHPLEQLRRETSPMLSSLSRELANSVVLVIYLGIERLVVDVGLSPGTLNPYYNSWLQGPLHGSGPGKALLLTVDEPRRRQLLGPEPYRRYTQHTLTSWAEVSADLKIAEERGYAVVRDEFYQGLSAISCNFRSWSGRMAGCFAVTGHTRDMTDDGVERIGREILRIAGLMPLQASSLGIIDSFCGY